MTPGGSLHQQEHDSLAKMIGANERRIDSLAEELPSIVTNAVRFGIAEGVREVLSDRATMEVFWSSAGEALSTHAARTTGKFVLGGIKAAMHKAALLFGLGLVVYSLGGWAALRHMWDFMTRGPG